jgi:hypothetical protein
MRKIKGSGIPNAYIKDAGFSNLLKGASFIACVLLLLLFIRFARFVRFIHFVRYHCSRSCSRSMVFLYSPGVE